MARLNGLVTLTGALVVVSSSWRYASTVAKLQALLERYGFVGEIIGVTPTLEGAGRGAEIRAWLDALAESPVAFVVLDDDSDMVAISDHFVKTSFHGGGLTDELAAKAARLLHDGQDRRENLATA